MKVLVTGANGFVGNNLCMRIRARDDIELIKYDIGDDFSRIENHIVTAKYVFHLAGVNRPKDAAEFYLGNSDFTISLVELIKKTNAKATVIMSSSIQATLDNDYGKSKKLAEDAILSLAGQNNVYVYRFHNIYGKWCKPNYNSVVATWCNNIMRSEQICVSNPDKEIELVYIDDVVDEFMALIEGGEPSEIVGEYCYIHPRDSIRLDDLAEQIIGFKGDLDNLRVPETGDRFVKNLFSTFLSYAKAPDISKYAQMHNDDRGSFTELVHTLKSGQISVSLTRPGIVRGNHYHNTKVEQFAVVRGNARIRFRHVLTNERMDFTVSGETSQIITIPPGYTHNIENTGSEDLVLVIWANECFDPNNPDTYYEEV
jgi:UDP-2-acetamido-2,6-beta-L-arabino-hexul-4-ose reductase